KRSARNAAGSRAARWFMAERRPGIVRTPIRRNRAPRFDALTGRPAESPGKSHGEAGGRRDAVVGPLALQQRDEQASQRLGNVDAGDADLEADVFVGDAHLIPREGGNPGDLLAIEQDEAPGDAVPGLESVVMEKPVNEGPAGVLVHRGTDTWEGGRDDQASGELAFLDPIEEV